MRDVDTGGPAFPGLHPSKECHYQDAGMTLRDYFAAKAMQALLTKLGPYGEDLPKPYREVAMDCEMLAEYAFIQADAMLVAREL
jgi:hypothetical protein